MNEETKIGNTFWKTPEGKILGHGIHEHNSGLGIISNYLKHLKYIIENDLEKDKDDLLKVLESIEKARIRCRESMDYIYTNIKELNESKDK